MWNGRDGIGGRPDVEPAPPSRRMMRAEAWGGAISLTVGLFVVVTRATLIERAVAFDAAVLRALARLRAPSLNAVMVDVTALGSPTVVALFTIVTFAVLIVFRDRWGVLQLAVASVGTGILTAVMKNALGRMRPTEVPRLVEVSGYSYPSGHSLAATVLFLTMAIVAGRHLRTKASKAVLVAGASLLIATVGLSRVYLGVHYPSDVVGGIALGTAWALLLAAAIATIVARRART